MPSDPTPPEQRRNPMVVGYARSAPSDPLDVLERQVDRLSRSGCRRIFTDFAVPSTERPQWDACDAFLGARDILVVDAAEHVAQSVSGLLALRDNLRDRDTELVVLGFAGERLDWRANRGKEPGQVQRLLEEVVAWERRVQRERQAAGIEKAKAEGKFTGSKPQVDAAAILSKLDAGQSPTAIAKELGIGRTTVYRVQQDHQREMA